MVEVITTNWARLNPNIGNETIIIFHFFTPTIMPLDKDSENKQNKKKDHQNRTIIKRTRPFISCHYLQRL